MSAGNMEQMSNMGNYGKVVQDAGKYGTGAKRGKTYARQLVKLSSMCYILCQMKNDFLQSIMVHFGKLVNQVLDGYQFCIVVLSYYK